jgi:hypothetical protein
MKHRGSTIVAMRGKIGTLAALTDEAPTPGGPSPPHTGSRGGDLDAEGVTLAESDQGRPWASLLAVSRHAILHARFTDRGTAKYEQGRIAATLS